MKKLLVLSCVVAFIACGKPKGPRAFTYATAVEITSLDPAFPYDGVSHGLLYNVYETLVAFEGETNDKIVPRLAAEVPSLVNGLISKDGLSYRFPIRKGVKFHDGRELTPDDVRYSLLRFMLLDRDGGPSSLLLEPILAVTSTRKEGKLHVTWEQASKAVSVDGDAVVVRLKTPFGPFLPIMARWSYVVSRSWAKEKGDWDGEGAGWERFNNPKAEDTKFFAEANGTGPFKVERWDRVGRRVHLVRHEASWRGPARLERVMLVATPEFSTRKLLLQGGDADIIDVPRPFLSQLEGLSGVSLRDDLPRLQTDPSFFFTFKINAAANPDMGSGKLDGEGIPADFFTDKDLRKGFAYAFDYAGYIRDTFKGKAVRAISSIPPGLPGHDAAGPHYDLDLKKAEEHFKKAWGGKVWEKGFRFTLTYNTGGDTREAACQILKKGVESLNPKFRIDLRGVEWAAFLDRGQRRQMPLFSRGWTADYPDAHNFAFPFYHHDGRYPTAQGYSDPVFDALVEKAVREVDPAKRAALYAQVARRAFEEVPQITTVHPAGVFAMRDDVKGFYDNAVLGGVDFYPLSR